MLRPFSHVIFPNQPKSLMLSGARSGDCSSFRHASSSSENSRSWSCTLEASTSCSTSGVIRISCRLRRSAPDCQSLSRRSSASRELKNTRNTTPEGKAGGTSWRTRATLHLRERQVGQVEEQAQHYTWGKGRWGKLKNTRNTTPEGKAGGTSWRTRATLHLRERQVGQVEEHTQHYTWGKGRWDKLIEHAQHYTWGKGRWDKLKNTRNTTPEGKAGGTSWRTRATLHLRERQVGQVEEHAQHYTWGKGRWGKLKNTRNTTPEGKAGGASW